MGCMARTEPSGIFPDFHSGFQPGSNIQQIAFA
jgi:hypothetical protein